MSRQIPGRRWSDDGAAARRALAADLDALFDQLTWSPGAAVLRESTEASPHAPLLAAIRRSLGVQRWRASALRPLKEAAFRSATPVAIAGLQAERSGQDMRFYVLLSRILGQPRALILAFDVADPQCGWPSAATWGAPPPAKPPPEQV